MRISRLATASVNAVVLSACTRVVPPSAAPPAYPHVPEPVVRLMEPIVLPMPGTRDSLQYLVDSVIAAPMWRNARWGVLLVDPLRNDTILSHDADRLFMPASNQKLLTAAIALAQLGPDYRWQTPFLLDGTQRGSTFQGDLLVEGNGDPSISDALRGGRAASAFDAVIDSLTKRGITRITGRVLKWGDAFSGATTGYGWAKDDLGAGYSAAIDELTYNEGELRLHVTGGAKAGAPIMVKRSPTERYPPLVIEAVTGDHSAGEFTAGSTRTYSDRLTAVYDSIANAVVVSGRLPPGTKADFTIAYRHPADAFTAAVREELHRAGILVQGNRIPRADANQAGAARQQRRERSVPHRIDTLGVIESVPFGDILRRMQKPSQNQIAELLFRTSGRVASGDGSADSARAVATRTLAGWGIAESDVAYRDGSGLSRHDYVTPRAVVRVLDAMYRSPWSDLYRHALPLAGVDGTIAARMRDTPAAGNASAKTGTLDKARSLSGYVTSRDGRLLLFSLLCNNFTVPTVEVERVQDMLVSIMADGTFPELSPP